MSTEFSVKSAVNFWCILTCLEIKVIVNPTLAICSTEIHWTWPSFNDSSMKSCQSFIFEFKKTYHVFSYIFHRHISKKMKFWTFHIVFPYFLIFFKMQKGIFPYGYGMDANQFYHRGSIPARSQQFIGVYQDIPWVNWPIPMQLIRYLCFMVKNILVTSFCCWWHQLKPP